MPNDPVEFEYTRWEQQNLHNIEVDDDRVTTIEASNEWIGERNALATAMYNHWLANGGGQEVYPPWLRNFVFVLILFEQLLMFSF